MEKKKSLWQVPFFFDDVMQLPLFGAVKGYYIIILALAALFILTKNPIVGLAAGFVLVSSVLLEFAQGVSEGGWKNELKETAIAIGIALLVWFGSGFLLNTPTPINAIVSCSMLPDYDRGDLVILQGGDISTKIVPINSDISSVGKRALIKHGGEEFEVNGSIYSYCTGRLSMGEYKTCKEFFDSPESFEEWHGPLKVNYGKCIRYYPKGRKQVETICAKSVEINGKLVEFDRSDDIMVYSAREGELYSLVGDIIHRVAFGVKAKGGQTYYFTKGDNNPVYDFQIYSKELGLGNGPISMNQSKGKVIARIPYLGNFKLFITPQVLLDAGAMAGCDSYFKP